MTLSARNRLSGTVTNVETDGPVAEVTVELAGGETLAATITAESVERLGIAEGEAVDAVIKASSVMIDS
jgi:molybdate transport system regulatory protein